MNERLTHRKTKIIATIGPASDDPATLKTMVAAGMNVARLNLSHGDLDEQARRLERIRHAAREAGALVAIMIDTQGMEVRCGALNTTSVELKAGDCFSLYAQERLGDVNGVCVSYPALIDELEPGVRVLLDDGLIELRTEQHEPGVLRCQIVVGGILGARKGINIPDSRISLGFNDPETRKTLLAELQFAAEQKVDYIAASFIQCAEDVHTIRGLLRNFDVRIPIIAKIESRDGVENLDTIVAAANGTMVARGDLGVELPLAEVPGAQKKIIYTTVYNGKPVITATQMLDSMERNPRPTRAEASDVANAILDGTSAVMLSGETAVGKYPVESLSTMATLALKAESYLKDYGHLQKIQPNPTNRITEAVSQAAVSMAGHLGAAAVISLTTSGFTSRLISKHRPDCPILAITESSLSARRLSINWGVVPIQCPQGLPDRGKIAFAISRGIAAGYLLDGDLVVATAGFHELPGATDQIRVIKVAADKVHALPG